MHLICVFLNVLYSYIINKNSVIPIIIPALISRPRSLFPLLIST